MRNIIFSVVLVFSGVAIAEQAGPCLIDGQYELKLHPWGYQSPFWLEGNLAGEAVRFRVSGFMQFGILFVDDSFRDIPVKLNIEVSSVYNNQWISGTIGKTNVGWPGNYGLFTGYTGCIQ